MKPRHNEEVSVVEIATSAVEYTDADTRLTAFVAVDVAHAGPRPGVLVVHGGAGLDEHARGRARQMAALGYVALACDMYGEGVAGDRDRIMAAIASLRSEPGRLVRRAMAGVERLLSHPLVDGRVAAVGYCFGGLTVLELARAGAALKGVVSVHGTLTTSAPAAPGGITAHVLVCHGALDPHVPTAQVTAFADEMRDAGADWQLNVYGRAVHGFTHEEADGVRMPGVRYDAASDRRSSAAIRLFLEEAFEEEAFESNPVERGLASS